MVFRKTNAVYFENATKPVKSVSGLNAVRLFVKARSAKSQSHLYEDLKQEAL
jgi:hypothetical protein